MTRPLIGMSVALPRLDLEAVVEQLRELGFDGVEVHLSQLGSGFPSVPVTERAAEATAEMARRAGLRVTGLNAVDDASFAPFGSQGDRERTVAGLTHHVRLAAAMGASPVVIWDGRVRDQAEAETAPALLSGCIEAALERSGLDSPPAVSIELHPFTFALAYGRLDELGTALRGVGAGICADFCHLGVSLGADFVDRMAGVLDLVNHVHYSDTDCRSSELHLPPGDGTLDLDAVCRRVIGRRRLDVAWDLFGWPAPRDAMRTARAAYEHAVALAEEA